MGYLAVQRIEIAYHDDHRGRVDAEQRARLRGLPIAAIAGDGVYHDCRANAWTGYEPTTGTSGLPLRDGEVVVGSELRLRRDDDRLVFVTDAGAQPWKSKPILEVPVGSWGRVVLNRKEWNSEHKWLVEIVVNAGLFEEPPEAQVFLGAPAAERDVRHDYLRNGYR